MRNIENIEITDDMIADYSAGWSHANNTPESQREPGDRRRAGLTAVVPEIIGTLLRDMYRHAETHETEEFICLTALTYGIEL